MSQLVKALGELNRGAALEDADAALARVVAAVQETGRPGSLTIKIKVEPAEIADNALMLTPEISAKEPGPKRPQSMFFVDGGKLSRTDPRQPELQFTAIPGGKTNTETPAQKEATA